MFFNNLFSLFFRFFINLREPVYLYMQGASNPTPTLMTCYLAAQAATIQKKNETSDISHGKCPTPNILQQHNYHENCLLRDW